MKVTRVCCQGCGASLDVDETLRFVTCNYCDARLEIVHDTSTTHTRLLEDLNLRAAHLEENVQHLRLQGELELLDRDWDRKREALLGSRGAGDPDEASNAGQTFVTIFVIGFAVVWTGVAAMMFPPFALFGIGFLALVLINLTNAKKRAERYRVEKAAYESARAKLLNHSSP